MLRALSSGAPSGVLESRSLDGVAMLSAFSRSKLSGWSVIVGTPLDRFQTAARRAAWQGSLLAIAILLVGSILAALLAGKLASAVRALENAVGSSDAGERQKPTGISEVDAVADALSSSFAAKARSERHQQILIGELNHRVKNTLSVVQSLAHQTFRGNRPPQEAIAAFEARLQALAAAHNLLTSERWETASMRQIIQTALTPFCAPDRCEVEGPDVRIAPQTAVTLALAMHELATNASKYGALSRETGKIHVEWSVRDREFTLEWRESNGPPVSAPKSEGFGMRLIKRSLAAELGGTVETEFRESGLVCRIVGTLSARPQAPARSLQSA
jgi:two-component sensor histidine kinase